MAAVEHDVVSTNMFGTRPMGRSVERAAMRVYTGRGDGGETDLGDQSSVSKSHPRIEAYGTVDELNATIGTVRPTDHEDVDQQLTEIQHTLFVIQSELAQPSPIDDIPRVEETDTDQLESWIDEYEDELPALDSFVLPSGVQTATELHRTRTVCRRAERRVVALAGSDDAFVNDAVLPYLNRLSDYFFTAARAVNHRAGVTAEEPNY
jgi:cob(I)alamin adenosyltransferase